MDDLDLPSFTFGSQGAVALAWIVGALAAGFFIFIAFDAFTNRKKDRHRSHGGSRHEVHGNAITRWYKQVKSSFRIMRQMERQRQKMKDRTRSRHR